MKVNFSVAELEMVSASLLFTLLDVQSDVDCVARFDMPEAVALVAKLKQKQRDIQDLQRRVVSALALADDPIPSLDGRDVVVAVVDFPRDLS